MSTIILGGGIAGLSLAHFLDDRSVILEKQAEVGGLCRSFSLNGIAYDVGPHIIFSKHEDVLQLHTSLTPVNKIRRENKIFYKGQFVKYPFENELSALSAEERNWCLTTFLDNPYEDYEPRNMLQFFLKTFGEGITNLYLRPYNEKVWKLDPAYLDMQMVERIPKPPKADVIASAKGKATEGYKHQLYFYYPKAGGFQALINAYVARLEGKATIETGVRIKKVTRRAGTWVVQTNRGEFRGKRLVNCIPLPELFQYIEAPKKVREALERLRYNSIHIVVVQAKRDTLGNKFAIYVPDPAILFNRVSKINFLGPAYRLPGKGTTLMAEVTFRPNSGLSRLSPRQVAQRVVEDLVKLKFIRRQDVLDTSVHTEKYEYVVYDLNHRASVDTLLNFLKAQGIRCVGRFAEFEYVNSDQVVFRTQQLAKEMARL